MTQEQIDKAFNDLYVSLSNTKVVCWDDCMIYTKIPFGKNESYRRKIEAKIKELNLPLYVEPKSTNGLFQDKITVKPILNEK